MLPLMATAPRFNVWNARIAVSGCLGVREPRGRDVQSSSADRAAAVTRVFPCLRDRRVETPVEGMEFFYRDGAGCSTASAVIVWQMSP